MVHSQSAPDWLEDSLLAAPLTTARVKLLAEFDYAMRPAPSFPLLDTTRERNDWGYFKRRGLPALYRTFMLRGRA